MEATTLTLLEPTLMAPQGLPLVNLCKVIACRLIIGRCPMVPLGTTTHPRGPPLQLPSIVDIGLIALIIDRSRVTWAYTCSSIGALHPLDSLKVPWVNLQVLVELVGLNTGIPVVTVQRWSLRLPREERTVGLLVM